MNDKAEYTHEGRINFLEQQLELQNKIIKVLEKSNDYYSKEENWIKYNKDCWLQSSPKEHGDKELIRNFIHKKIDCTGSIIVGGKRARQAKEDVERLRGLK